VSVRKRSLIALAAACLLGCGSDGKAREPAHRLLVVGWDGATFRMIDPLLRAGRLPHLASMLDRGASARLESTAVPISSAAWTGMVTGKNPAQTGVFSFFEPIEGSYDVSVIGSRSNRATPIWRTLTRRGLTSVIFGVPVTYPPEPIRGTLVAGMLSPDEADFAWPLAYSETLRARGFAPDLGMWRREQPILDPAVVERQLALKQEILLELLGRENWDLAWIVFKSLDVLSHQAFDGGLNGRVAALCERLDSILGVLLENVGPDVNVLVVSDHGFNAYPVRFHSNSWMIREGFSVLTGGRGASPAGPMPLAEGRARAHKLRMEEFDSSRTRAFSTTSEGNFGSLRLNLAGREPRGAVAPEAAQATLDEITARLGELRLPNGTPLVSRVWRSGDLYPGRYGELLPDILFEVDPSVAVVHDGRGPVLQDLGGSVFPDHDRQGILIAAGPDIARDAARFQASVFDVAPTALHLLGLPIYDDLSGVVRAELLRAPAPARKVSESQDPPDDPALRTFLESGSELSASEIEQLERRLSATGYVK
jgi:predicted AlkP superfamily phosphohydrolase/phosphomutase